MMEHSVSLVAVAVKAKTHGTRKRCFNMLPSL